MSGPAAPEERIAAAEQVSPYTQAQAAGSLRRATFLVLGFAAVAAPVAWLLRGWQSAALLVVGAAISASGLYEWAKLMAALMHRMEVGDAQQIGVALEERKGPSTGFAIAGFAVRLVVVVAVLYVSLTYLHGSVLALAVGLALGVISLLVEGLRLLRSGAM